MRTRTTLSSLDAVIRQAADLGYQGIALGGFPPHASVELYPTRAARRELMRKVRGAGLEVNSYAADLLDCHFYDGSAGGPADLPWALRSSSGARLRL